MHCLYVDVILVTQMNSSQLITGYSSIQIPLFQPYITISCDSPNNTWLIELSRINSSYLGYGNQRVNGTTINVIDGMLTIGSFGVYESGTYTCDPGTTRQTTIYLQSSGKFVDYFKRILILSSAIAEHSFLVSLGTEKVSFLGF